MLNYPIRAVGFDLDDTLCVYLPVAVRARRQVFEELLQPLSGLDVEALDQHYRHAFKSMYSEIQSEQWYPHYLRAGVVTRTETFRRMLHRLGLPTDGLAEQVSERYAQLREQYLHLHDDALPVLTELKTRYPLVVVTNGPAYEQRRELQLLGIESLFDGVAIEGEVGVGKPNPAIFRYAESLIQIPAEQILFVGNSWEHDVQGALNAGWQAVWLNREGTEPPTSEPVPTIQSLYELLQWL
ncbi:MAG: HAD family hydrolase [Fimbriimonadales bacterium]